MWSWNMTERLKRTGIPKIKMPVQMGDRVCLVYYDGQPTDITYPIMGNTLRDILISIDEGMRKPVVHSRFIDRILDNFIEPWRTQLRQLYHRKLATPSDLIGDYTNFEFGLVRRPDGLWTYSYGS